jgi:glycosyltransferase involved in cell wall biosynthesis
VSEIPEEVRRLAARRERARRAKEFAAADDLRQRIRDAGYEVTDTPEGPILTARPAGEQGSNGPAIYGRADAVESRLGEPPGAEASVQWVVQGWPDDVLRGIESVRRFTTGRSVQQVVVDLTKAVVEWPGDTDLVHLAPEAGWAAARNAGLRRSSGRIVVLIDGCLEATGDVVGPLLEALEDPTVGVTGPFGIVTDDLHEFRDDDGPEVDAVEAYLMAFRRDLVETGLRFDEKFRFYRTADIELSFQVKSRGLRATVTPLPVRRHEHRVWENTPEAERARLSKRNFYRFLDRWRGRTDLLVRDLDR